jgi:lipopolysaccharide transport system ATP-binding protein
VTKATVRVENVSKQYRIGARREPYSTLRDAITRAVLAPVKHLARNGSANGDTVWALKEIDFEVAPGEVLGVIGRNGAGKSTLLKILSRITQPTTGRAELFGRIGSLLEVGTGFHPELTGRENIFLNGAVLGMKRAEITSRFDEIVAFSEIEKFLDTPVKHYSSGMYMRLAFSVAAHLNPEILLMDEVLAVGDAAFQEKCLGKMGSVANDGRTVLFVSHNIVAVQNLCRRVIWLDEGRIHDQGPTHKVVKNYLAAASASVAMEKVWDDAATAPGNERVRIRSIRARPIMGCSSDPITVQTSFVLEFEYWNLEPDARLNLSLHLYNQQGITILNSVPVNEPAWHGRAFPVGLFRSACHVPGNLLNDGLYRVLLLVVKDQGTVIFSLNDALVFNVLDRERPGDWHGKWEGAVRPDLVWTTEYLNDAVNPVSYPVQ